MNWGGLHTVISGGQTGADQGGLLAARDAGVRTGGTAPALYKTAIGYNPLLEAFGLVAAGDYSTRTRQNVRDSDATVILSQNMDSPGTVLTRQFCVSEQKPRLELNIAEIVEIAKGSPTDPNVDSALNLVFEKAGELVKFIQDHNVQVLNVAGNRERPGLGFGGKLVTTMTVRWIVGTALEILNLEQKLVKI